MKRRSDAVENRALLIGAAKRVFAAHGVGAPLDLVVREAGVGRGTLYRHFPDRETLVAAILDDRITDLSDAIDQMPADHRLERVLLQYCDYLLDTPGLITTMRTSPAGRAHMKSMQDRFGGLIEEVVASARARGELWVGLSPEDVTLALAMMEGAVASTPEAPGPALARRTVELLVRCLREPSTLDRPLPEPGPSQDQR